MTSDPLPRLASHGLAATTAEDVARILRVTEREHFSSVWADVCRTAGVSQGAYLLDLDQAARLVAAVRARPGVTGLAGRDLAVRVDTYRLLAVKADGTGATASEWSRRALERLLRSRILDRTRLEEIVDLDVFGERGCQVMTQAANKVANRLGTPIGATSVVVDGAQLLGGKHGIDGWVAEACGVPVEWSFCATTLRTRQPYVVEDAGADVVQRTNPLVRQDGVLAYAGAPVTTSRGHVLGALCVLDAEARTFGQAEIDVLRAGADSVAERLEEQRVSQRSRWAA